MREFFIFNCEAITVNLRKKRKMLNQLLVSWVLHMYSHVTFSYIKHNWRNLLTIFHPPPQDSQGAPRHLTSEVGQSASPKECTRHQRTDSPTLAAAQDTSSGLLLGGPAKRKSTQNLTPTWGKETSLGHDKERAKAELHMQGAVWEWRAANSVGLGQYRALMERMSQRPATMAPVIKDCTYQLQIKHTWKQQKHWERLEAHKDIE